MSKRNNEQHKLYMRRLRKWQKNPASEPGWVKFGSGLRGTVKILGIRIYP